MSTDKVRCSFLKYPGSKRRLIPWLRSLIDTKEYDIWLEPFVGSCTVPMNFRAKKYILADINPVLIDMYTRIRSGDITESSLKEYLVEESKKLQEGDQKYFLEVRDRYNKTKSAYDYIFLIHTCFNGAIRHNSKGDCNSTYCNERDRLKEKKISDILSKFRGFKEFLVSNDIELVNASFDKVVSEFGSLLSEDSFVYCDPPYIGTACSYTKENWNQGYEYALKDTIDSLSQKGIRFGVSTWNNENNDNPYIDTLWSSYNQYKIKKTFLMNGKTHIPVDEILITNIPEQEYHLETLFH